MPLSILKRGPRNFDRRRETGRPVSKEPVLKPDWLDREYEQWYCCILVSDHPWMWQDKAMGPERAWWRRAQKWTKSAPGCQVAVGILRWEAWTASGASRKDQLEPEVERSAPKRQLGHQGSVCLKKWPRSRPDGWFGRLSMRPWRHWKNTKSDTCKDLNPAKAGRSNYRNKVSKLKKWSRS